jgi:hypothetical protein
MLRLLLSTILLVLMQLMQAAVAHAHPEYIEVLTGQARGPLSDPQPDYETIPVHVIFGQDAEPWINQVTGADLTGRWRFEFEPFIEPLIEPRSNVEFGFTLNLKIGPEIEHKFYPYAKFGTGVMYTTQGTLEQATRLNFTSFGAIGIDYHLSEHEAISIESRYRHWSNAGLEPPNSGVDMTYLLVGYTRYLDE